VSEKPVFEFSREIDWSGFPREYIAEERRKNPMVYPEVLLIGQVTVDSKGVHVDTGHAFFAGTVLPADALKLAAEILRVLGPKKESP
jgi:sugar phosphate isomerase/epimerase